MYINEPAPRYCNIMLPGKVALQLFDFQATQLHFLERQAQVFVIVNSPVRDFSEGLKLIGFIPIDFIYATPK